MVSCWMDHMIPQASFMATIQVQLDKYCGEIPSNQIFNNLQFLKHFL